MDIKDLLTEERVAVDIDADDWEAAVRAAGRLLVDSGAAEERYIDGMVNTTKELGPYIVIAPGLAIPHGRPEDGVIEPSLAVVTLKTPVSFGHAENDPVRVLVALGATDSEQHVEALRQMAEILSDQENFAALMSAKTISGVLKVMWGAG